MHKSYTHPTTFKMKYLMSDESRHLMESLRG